MPDYVLHSVERYLKNRFQVQRALFDNKQYTVKTHCPIRSWNRKVDIALLADDKLIAIAVCTVGTLEQDKANGIKQLRTYLMGTEAELVIFANSVTPDKWRYYKSMKKTGVTEINRSHFEKLIIDTKSSVQPTKQSAPTLNSEPQTAAKTQQRQTQDNLYLFTCSVGEKLPRAFRGHFDLDIPNNDYLLTDIGDVNLKGREYKSELKITLFSTDPYSVKLWNLTKAHRQKIRDELKSNSSLVKPTTQPSKTPKTQTLYPTPKPQQNVTPKNETHPLQRQPTKREHQLAKPKTENDIRNIVQKTLQATIDVQPIKEPIYQVQWEFKKEYTVRWGREQTGRADLVLLLNNIPFVIVECKRPGLVGGGKEQLESYLNGTRARLGIFANNPDPAKWIYYDTTIGFDEIDRQTFNEKLYKQHQNEHDVEAQAQQQKQQRIDIRAKQLVTQKDINERTEQLIAAAAKERLTENAIQDSVATILRQQIKTLQYENSKLKAEVSEKSGCAIWGWCLFGFAVFIIIGIASGW